MAILKAKGSHSASAGQIRTKASVSVIQEVTVNVEITRHGVYVTSTQTFNKVRKELT